jgi:AcrR family transcriptional regulator
MAKKQTKPQRIRIADRRRRVAELVLSGERSASKIAAEVGCSRRTVYNDFDHLEAEWNRLGASVVGKMRDAQRGVNFLRLERAIALIEPDLHDRERRIPAARLLKELIERQAKLCGLDMPTKSALTDPTGEREYAGIPESFKQRMIEAEVIDAEIVSEK